jgi:hypothetical protein
MEAKQIAKWASGTAAFIVYTILLFYFLLPILDKLLTSIIWLVSTAVIYSIVKYSSLKKRKQQLQKAQNKEK